MSAEHGREMTLVLFFKKHAEERAEFSGSVPIASSSATSAVGYAKFFSRSHDAVIRVYDESGDVIETHDHAADIKEW
jgi:hypothetical protein